MTTPVEPDARRRAQRSKDHHDCRSATIRPSLDKIALALSSPRDNYHLAATAKMAILVVAAFPSRLSRYSARGNRRRTAPSDRAKQFRVRIWRRAAPVDKSRSANRRGRRCGPQRKDRGRGGRDRPCIQCSLFVPNSSSAALPSVSPSHQSGLPQMAAIPRRRGGPLKSTLSCPSRSTL